MSKISLPQKNIQINGGKRFVFTMSAIIAAISSAVAYGASLVTFPNVVAAITLASGCCLCPKYHLVKAISISLHIQSC